jgi:DNA mismatch repair protein MutS2
MRRAVLAELASSKELHAEFEQIYLDLVRVRALFCAGRQQPAQGLRRLEILRTLHGLFQRLASSFSGASSALDRITAFGTSVCASEAFRRLEALLDHEEHLGTVDVRVRVGSDGEVRTFQIVKVRENEDNPFHSSPIGRWLAKLRLFLRGYRVSGNEVVERLFDDVFTDLETSIALLFQLMGDMEFYLAGLSFAQAARESGLEVCLPDLTPIGAPERSAVGLRYAALYNPLLLGDKARPVPCDLDLANANSVVLVTGPNSGGKTRLLQAIAIAQILGEAGLFVPAREARIPMVSGLFVSLLEEARADQPEGQLGMELMRIRRMFEELEMGSLVLLDELCSGTNPSEGEEIARLVISLLPELEAQVFVTTHLLQFAEQLSVERPIPRLEFLQVELDAHELPTYRFAVGVARTSLAHKTAARLGVTRGELLGLVAAKRRALETSTSMPPKSEPDAPASDSDPPSPPRREAGARLV